MASIIYNQIKSNVANFQIRFDKYHYRHKNIKMQQGSCWSEVTLNEEIRKIIWIYYSFIYGYKERLNIHDKQ